MRDVILWTLCVFILWLSSGVAVYQLLNPTTIIESPYSTVEYIVCVPTEFSHDVYTWWESHNVNINCTKAHNYDDAKNSMELMWS